MAISIALFLSIAGFSAFSPAFLWSWIRQKKKARPSSGIEISSDQHVALQALIERYGSNTNSIYHLYGHFQHFFPKLPMARSAGALAPALGFREQRRQNILLADPLCAPEQTTEALRSFIGYSEHQGRDAIFFAINESTAQSAKHLGYHLIKIGKEPVFDLHAYSVDRLPLKLRSAVRQVFKKGIVIEELSIHTLKDQRLIDSLDEVLHQWLLSRQSDAFKLLTEVNPLAAAGDKKFFVARHGESVEAFLACSPIPARHGYFLHDLIRRPFALNGVSEALVVTALETLAAQGFAMASLGISPLAGLDEMGPETAYPRLNAFLRRIFESSTYPYNFSALYHFKKKFLPTSEEAAYLAVPPGGLKLRHVLGVILLFNDFNLAREIRHKFRQWQAGYNIPRLLGFALDPNKIPVAPLSNLSFESFGNRFRFTIAMLFLNIFAFVYTSDSMGEIKVDILEKYGFSYQHLREHGWYILFTSNFVHFHYPHLIGNMVALLIFTGCLELIGGTALAFLIYMVGMQSNIPNGVITLPLLRLIEPAIFSQTVAYVDVGASLGIMATFGGLAYFMKPAIRNVMLVGSILFFTAFSIARNEFIGFDHGFGVLTGYLIAVWYLRHQVAQDIFESTKFKFFDVAAHRAKLDVLQARSSAPHREASDGRA